VSVTLARLEGILREYAWGSRTFLAQLRGQPSPTSRPQAELWLGAHPTGPAALHLADGRTVPLDDAIADDPIGMLGGQVVERFGTRLPFLLKILAAAKPLSLQAHPSAERARAGFADEEARGIPLDAPHRRYRDAWPKPELFRALTPFTALCGFREPRGTLELLDELAVDELRWVRDELRHGESAIVPVVRRLLTLSEAERAPLVTAVATAASRHLGYREVGVGTARFLAHGPRDDATDDDGPWTAELRLVRSLAVRYPADPGVIVALLMRLIRLAPGQALYLPAGNLHAYVEGAGIELMAASDNVLRGGLTVKHVDVDELLQVLDVRTGEVPWVAPTAGVAGERVLTAPTPFFRLSELTPSPNAEVALDRRGPQVLLCTAGDATVTADPASISLTRGQAAYVAASAEDVLVGTDTPGGAEVFRATVGGD
jgi:mannose-6-phosphate isomerase